MRRSWKAPRPSAGTLAPIAGTRAIARSPTRCWVYVADRENHRIQVFDGNGKFETQWHNLHRPSGLYMPPGKCPICYIGEIGPHLAVNRGMPNLGPRISIVPHEGKLLGRLGRVPPAGPAPGQFLSPHGIAVDSRGDLYVGEVSVAAWPSLF